MNFSKSSFFRHMVANEASGQDMRGANEQTISSAKNPTA
jgi:hypothetical protein